MKIYFLVRIEAYYFCVTLSTLYCDVAVTQLLSDKHQRMGQLGDTNETTSPLNCGCLYKQEFLL